MYMPIYDISNYLPQTDNNIFHYNHLTPFSWISHKAIKLHIYPYLIAIFNRSRFFQHISTQTRKISDFVILE